MPGKRKKGLSMTGFHATPKENADLKEAAQLAGFSTLADYFRWIAKVKPVPPEGYKLSAKED